MKKRLLFSMLITIISLTSYSNTNSNVNGAEKLTVSFTINSEIQTRTNTPATASRHVLEIYEGTTVEAAPPVYRIQENTNTFNVDLKKDTDYICLLWADDGTKDANTGTYNAADLRSVTLNADKVMISEAYFANQSFRITGNTTSSNITLKHAVAKVVLIEDATITQSAVLNLYFYVYTAFNVSNEMVVGGASPRTVSFTTSTTNRTIGEFYSFASVGTKDTGGTMTSFSYHFQDGASVMVQIPVAARLSVNYITNLIGGFTQ